jgi:hypothetical protein
MHAYVRIPYKDALGRRISMPSSTLCVTKGNKQELRITCHAYNLLVLLVLPNQGLATTATLTGHVVGQGRARGGATCCGAATTVLRGERRCGAGELSGCGGSASVCWLGTAVQHW